MKHTHTHTHTYVCINYVFASDVLCFSPRMVRSYPPIKAIHPTRKIGQPAVIGRLSACREKRQGPQRATKTATTSQMQSRRPLLLRLRLRGTAVDQDRHLGLGRLLLRVREITQSGQAGALDQHFQTLAEVRAQIDLLLLHLFLELRRRVRDLLLRLQQFDFVISSILLFVRFCYSFDLPRLQRGNGFQDGLSRVCDITVLLKLRDFVRDGFQEVDRVHLRLHIDRFQSCPPLVEQQT